MGSPLSAIVSGFVLDELFCDVKNNFPGLKFVCKYVDDSFFISDPSTLDHVFVFLNNFHTRLKFTREFEVNKILNFLDIKIHRVNNILEFDHYCKPTYTLRIINFLFNQPFHFKINILGAFGGTAHLSQGMGMGF